MPRMVLTGSDSSVATDGFPSGAENGGALELRAAAADGDDAAPIELGQFNEHEADGAEADDGDGVAGARGGFLKSAKARKRELDESGVLIADVRGDEVGIAFDECARGCGYTRRTRRC